MFVKCLQKICNWFMVLTLFTRSQNVTEPIRPNSTQFLPGNRAALGNRGPEVRTQLRRGKAALLALLNDVDKDGTGNWHKLWQHLFDRALAGDTKSAKLV